MLRCPICKNDLLKKEKTYSCKNNHSFDIAKQGYTNLLINQSSKIKGDSKEMLDARTYIQDKAFYEPLLEQVLNIIPQCNTLLDIGCGTGYYTNHFTEKAKNVIGIDIAKDALKIASRTGKEVDYFVASNKELPIKDNSVDIVVNIFAPIYLEEIKRVNKRSLIVVSPNSNHLIELKEIVYDSIIPKNEERHNLDLPIQKEVQVSYQKTLLSEEINNLFMMTPHYWTSSVNGKERLRQIASLDITFDFTITVYKMTTN